MLHNHTLIAQIPGYFFVKDRHSCFLLCNQNFADFAGETMESIIGKSEREMPWSSVADHFITGDRQVMESEIPLINYREVKPNAKGRHEIITNKSPLYDGAGKVIGVIGIFFILAEEERE